MTNPMSLDQALDILDQVPLCGGGRSIDLKKYPRALGSGLAPFEIESTAVDEARQALNAYIETFPVERRDEVSSQLWRDFCDIRDFKEARCDISFLDEEFGPVNKERQG